jgi:hypothetical protein
VSGSSNTNPRPVAAGFLDLDAIQQKAAFRRRDTAIRRTRTPTHPLYADAPPDGVETQIAFRDKDDASFNVQPLSTHEPIYFADGEWHRFGATYIPPGNPGYQMRTGVVGDNETHLPVPHVVGSAKPMNRVPFTVVDDWSDIVANTGAAGADGDGYIFRYVTGTGPGSPATPATIITSVEARRVGWYLVDVTCVYHAFEGTFFVLSRIGAGGGVYDSPEVVTETAASTVYSGDVTGDPEWPLGVVETGDGTQKVNHPNANPIPYADEGGVAYSWLTYNTSGGWQGIGDISYGHDAGYPLKASVILRAVYLGPFGYYNGDVAGAGTTKVV